MSLLFTISRQLRPLFPTKSARTIVTSAWDPFQESHGENIQELDEVKAVQGLLTFLKQEGKTTKLPRTPVSTYKHALTQEQYKLSLDAAMATFSLHVQARIASMVGHGFYTISPCGEELLAAAGLVFRPEDSTALHYRHTAMSIARQMNENPDKPIVDLLLARARGYTVSKYDPVTGGVHCSIGGGPNEYLVTSTLSSQCPAAVGRALGYSIAKKDNMDGKPISYTTLGDGSLHNHHFLSSLTLARHAKHLKVKCPIVFGISNNGLSISYETKNYIDTVFGTQCLDPLLPVFRANGQDMLSVYDQTMQACEYARTHQSPCVLLYSNLVRRFGHAATDRQATYLDSDQIRAMTDTCTLEMAVRQAVEQLNYFTYAELHDRFEEIHFKADQAFAQAMQEPKVDLEDMMNRVSAPLVPLPSSQAAVQPKDVENDATAKKKKQKSRPQVMRKHMNKVLNDIMEEDTSVVYLGEDVRHGGYYLVTEGLTQKFPTRVLDFPPDETTLMGAALGFAQLGMTPIVEIPYSKYLDCGVDMFYEIAIQHWLTAPEKAAAKPLGMIVRLQGFDRGVFGGNFHTHNMLSHMPPGVDVVCYSNGQDYVKGMKHALLQAKAGRIVMLVDCTNLLNLRHVHDRDRAWEFPDPERDDELLGFDEIRRYRYTAGGNAASQEDGKGTANTAIVSYGNGIVTSLQARKAMTDSGVLESEAELDIIDCPYLSGVPQQLETALGDYDKVLFADICKEGPGSNIFSSMILALKEKDALPPQWAFVGAPRTYNPLGSTVTFLNTDTIENALNRMLERSSKQNNMTCDDATKMHEV